MRSWSTTLGLSAITSIRLSPWLAPAGLVRFGWTFLPMGAHLSVRQVTFLYSTFAREAFQIYVDIDPFELQKPTLFADMPIHCDAKVLLEEIAHQLRDNPVPPKEEWIEWCRTRRQRY